MTQFAKVQASRSAFLRADIIVVLIAIIIGMGFTNFLSTGNAAFIEQVKIDTSLSALPNYALLSFVRSMLALLLSYTFAIIYGTIAANNKSFERFLIPLLDVLQSLPVLAFLPGFVLALISIFQSSRWGLELACLLTIFTGQVWNLAFAYYESQRTLQPEFKEVSKIYRLSIVQKFFFVDLPNGYRPLIYNGMMSMAGGWFFLTTCEAFTLGNKDFRLPGLGSYISETFSTGNYFNFCSAILILIVIIIGTDFLLWKPLIAWVTRFREGDDGKNVVVEESWFLNIIHQTSIPDLISNGFKRTVVFLFPKADISESGATRRYLIDNIEKWGTVISPTNWLNNDKVNKIKHSSLFPLLVTFAVGGLVFSLLPKLPTLGQSLASLSNKDWFTLIHAVFLTGAKVFCVIILSTLWTIPVGLWLGLNPRLERLFQPIIQNLAAFPAPVLFPFLALALSSLHLPSFLNATLLMCVGSQWYILFNVIGGASRIPAELKLVTQIYKFSLWHRFSKLYFPAILPSLATGWITAAGGAWNASVVAEIVEYPGGSMHSEGIGAELVNATASGNYQRLIAAIICIVVALVILNRTVWRTMYIYAERVKD
ncbi:ABC transporter permease subunit [Fluviispira multicolorata]|uniref:ABC transporter permease subunit n=1 Tax=Fluviispira multicolorata TaxID=2654512 RepID=A0A833JFF5_9BACT|nr:ABC transporter permease subunit [Fluviispira multicolorata]KAB8033726.1 ABC transporter permease subunit [Fluviispira multicolorata]